MRCFGLFLFITILSQKAAAVQTASQKLLILTPVQQTYEESSEENSTLCLIAYLSFLLENRVIEDASFLQFYTALEEGRLINPLMESKFQSSTAMIHTEGVQKYIDPTRVDLKKLLNWSQKVLKQRDWTREYRNKIQAETLETDQKMVFHPVRAGKFRMGPFKERKVKVTLTYPFEMMSTMVTQKHWVDLWREKIPHLTAREKALSELPHSAERDKTLKFYERLLKNPDLPMIEVSWLAAVEFANRLSIKAGYEPVYDLSYVDYADDRLEQGYANLRLAETIRKLKIRAPRGNIYRAEGYRLPTEAEWEYVSRAAGRTNTFYRFGDNEEELKEYAWYEVNSGGITHPVAQLKPLLIDGNDFYDMHGNYWEWCHDSTDKFLRWDCTNPCGPKKLQQRTQRGGSYFASAYKAHCGFRIFGCLYLNRLDHALGGFRLVRTIQANR